ncbi:MAG: chemotaxis response regulator protein-glutamate methylesterase [Gemmatimonadaceae bacterium]
MSSKPQHSVLVVDDSAFMRKIVSEIIGGTDDFYVVGTARNGQDAIEKVHALEPAIVTLDVEMPELDGLQALGYIMSEAPRPVVMLSAAAARGGDDPTLRALELGAVDFVRKPSGPVSGDIDMVRDRLLSALRAAAQVNMRGVGMLARPRRLDRLARAGHRRGATSVVVIAASTGGPRALADVIPGLPADLGAAVLVVQHMPRGFTGSFAQRLDGMSAMSVREAEDGEAVEDNHVYIAPGGRHMRIQGGDGRPVVSLDDTPPIWGVRPSADPLFRSVADVFGPAVVGVVLTGMGRDGAAGLRAVRDAGGGAIVQDRGTSVIFGMPQAAYLTAGADRVAALTDVPAAIVESLAARRRRPIGSLTGQDT